MDVLHHRWRYHEPTACGKRGGASTVSPSAVTCSACLAALEIETDDRTDEQKKSDLAAVLWRYFTT